MREVYINEQRVDVRPDDNVGYIFTSPIFRDITKILSNRTTTYKIPKTANNIRIFGQVDKPDVVSDFSKREYDFKEYRDGLLFISGKCRLLKSGVSDFEIGVIWGSAMNLLGLKDLKLRDCKINEYQQQPFVHWTEPIFFMQNIYKYNYGFLVVDYGKGLTDSRFVRPAINIQGILDVIKTATGVKIQYPARFEEVFKKKWIPIFENNANESSWSLNNYKINAKWSGKAIPVNNMNGAGWFMKSAHDPHNIISPEGLVAWRGNDFGIECKAKIKAKVRMVKGEPPLQMKLSWCRVVYVPSRKIGNVTFPEILHRIETIDTEIANIKSIDGKFGIYDFTMASPGMPENYKEGSCFLFIVSTVDEKNAIKTLEVETSQLEITIKEKEVKIGDMLPLIPNLPDIKVIDFLKSLMHMYGLFAYYDYRKPDYETTVEFISIDDIYDVYKEQAYDWTDKLTSQGRVMEITYTYDKYARRNDFKYATDDTVPANADGVIAIDNDIIDDQTTIVELPYAPSLNDADENGVFASIKLFDENGNKNNVTTRILNEDRYEIESKDVVYVSAVFDEEMTFNGYEGLLSKYYRAYVNVIKSPIVVEFEVMLSAAELYSYREVIPVYIEGVYYMILEMTASNANSGKSRCKCKAIRMPPLG